MAGSPAFWPLAQGTLGTWAFKAKYAAVWCFQSQDVPGKNSRQMWPHLLSPWKKLWCEVGGLGSVEQELDLLPGDPGHRPAVSFGTQTCHCRVCGQKWVNSKGECEKGCLWG